MSAPTPEPARRVVIAEDEALIRMDLAEMLTEEGFDVLLETVNATSDEPADLDFDDVYDTTIIDKIAAGE